MAAPPTVLAFARSTSGFYFGELLAGLNEELAAAGARLVVVQTLDPGDTADVVERIPTFDLPVARDMLAGVVAVSISANAEHLRALAATGLPVVLASHRVGGMDVPVALPDNQGGTAAAVEHLLAHGHRRVGFVGGTVQEDLRERHRAFVATLAQHGLDPVPAHVVDPGDHDEQSGYRTGLEIAALPAAQRPTALMVATDRTALGVLDALADSGLDVPADIAVIGFDNIEAGVFAVPSLSSVSQRFDAVGALAGRLLLGAMEGSPAPAGPAVPDRAVVVARGSCGCMGDLLGTSRASSVRTDAVPTADLRAHVVRVLSSAPDRPPSDTALEAVDRLLGPEGAADAAQLRALVHALRALGSRPDALHRTANALIEHLHRTTSPADPVRHAAAGTVASALWQVQSAAYLRRSRAQERLLTEQFQVAAGLLDSAVGDPRDLSWLAGTHVRAGALAMWEGEDRTSVRVTGTFGLDAEDLPDLVPVTAFPPAALVDQVRPERREACFVVPVRTLERDWGLLAVVGEIDTTSSRDTYHYWGQLLCSAFEAEALEHAVRASEERYALATRAANDGLWELELGAGAVHLSDRGRELLGLSPEDDPDTTWAARIHPEDVPLVHEIGRRAVRGRGTPVEGEFRVVHPDGSTRWLLVRCLGVPNTEDWVIRLVGSLADIQERKVLEEKLRQGALYDTVTGLPNRRLFLDRLAVALERPTRGDRGFAVVFLDLDGFKLVNDSLGHLLGDELLKVVAERLRDELRSVDTAARFGGDEFAVLLTAPSPEEVLVIARRIQERISAPVQLGEHEVQVTASVGITTSQVGYRDAEDVLRDADTAMYHAKGVERGTASVFDPEMHTRATGRLRTRGELRRALAEGQFVVHYQPVVALDGRGLTHLEALVRWDHPERGLLMPGTFLPTMEENASVVALGRWLLDEVCRQVAVWRSGHPQTPEVTVSINLSHREFWSADLVPALEAALATHDVPGECLVLEITERVVMTDAEAASAIMGALRATGVGLHIDDFGTGQSSLHALRTLPVDALKIDGSFIDELTTTGRAAELVEIILHMGRVLGVGVIAEQVETSAQAARLREMGCTDAQGWLYASALPGEQIGPLLGSRLPELTAAAPEDGVVA